MLGNRFAWISNRKTEILFTEIEIKMCRAIPKIRVGKQPLHWFYAKFYY